MMKFKEYLGESLDSSVLKEDVNIDGTLKRRKRT